MPENFNEKRRYPRVPMRLAVKVSTIDPETDAWSGKVFFRASREWCLNLSRGGALIQSAEPLAPGHRVMLEVELPDGRPLETLGRVAWTKTVIEPTGSRECGIGVEFLGDATDTLSRLEEILAYSQETPATDRASV